MSAASTPTPTDGTTGMACPEGMYCLQGTTAPEPCPLGTWSNSTGLARADDCPGCPGGYYCNGTGLTEPSGPCSARYYCVANATEPMPNDGLTGAPCTRTHYCPEGTADPLPCEDGTYMTNTHADVCLQCTPGHYCIDGDTPADCPPGFYCPLGTGEIWQSCPTGTFSIATLLSNETECTQCSGGFYCSQPNATSVTAPCDPGYYCTEGSDTATPDVGYKGTAGPCPTGHYCQAQTTIPDGCPVGTYSNQTHLMASAECTDCEYGKYCGEVGLSEPSADCWGGFYCLRGAESPNNPVLDSTGGPCPVGHYCPNGTAYPLGCQSGSYSPSTGLAECISCPAGYYCLENSTDYSSTPCQAGHYCPTGTGAPTDYPCDKGYYNNYTGKGQVEDCMACEPGEYCDTPGLSVPTDKCAPGWYCTRGAWGRKPTVVGDYVSDNTSMTDECFCGTNTTGGKCQPGEYCPQGSSEPTLCTAGKENNQ